MCLGGICSTRSVMSRQSLFLYSSLFSLILDRSRSVALSEDIGIYLLPGKTRPIQPPPSRTPTMSSADGEPDGPIDLNSFTPPEWIDPNLLAQIDPTAVDFSEPGTLLALSVLLGISGNTGPDSDTPWGIQLADQPNAPAVSAVLQRTADLLNAVIELVAKKTGRSVTEHHSTPQTSTYLALLGLPMLCARTSGRASLQLARPMHPLHGTPLPARSTESPSNVRALLTVLEAPH